MNIRSDVAGSGNAEAAPSELQVIDAADVFGLLSDPGRLRLLSELRDLEYNVGELAARSGLSESATSHALRLLRAHRIVEVRRTGRLAYYRLADDHVRQLLDMAFEHARHTSLVHGPGDHA